MDALIAGVSAFIVLLGSYGLYDLLMAPQALGRNASSQQADGNPRRSSGGILGQVLSGGMELCPGKDRVGILVLGTDERTEGGRADTIMLAIIDKKTKRVAAISVPRDLQVRMPGHGYQKINAIYAFHRRKGDGEIMTAQTVEEILGTDVDYYIKTDVTKFPKLFDALGGLDIYVDRDMYYRDRAGGLDIDLRKGRQHLNGKQIEGFVRHRKDKRGSSSSDTQRTQRQQYVLKELVKQKANLATATRLPQIVHTLQDMVKTNMTPSELAALGLLARQLDMQHVTSRVVPTHARLSGAWYAILEPGGTRNMMAEVDAALAGGEVIPDVNPEGSHKIGDGTLNPKPTEM